MALLAWPVLGCELEPPLPPDDGPPLEDVLDEQEDVADLADITDERQAVTLDDLPGYLGEFRDSAVVLDINRDGALDRVVFKPTESLSGVPFFRSGGMYVWFGTPGGDAAAVANSLRSRTSVFESDGDEYLDPPLGEGPADFRVDLSDVDAMPFGLTPYFGASAAVGDFNNDGFDDLAVGAPGARIDGAENAGTVAVFYGGSMSNSATKPTFLSTTRPVAFSQASPGAWGSAEADDFFGEALAAGDFDCDGHDDLAIGVPQEDIGNRTNAGVVHTFYGAGSGLNAYNTGLLRQRDVPADGNETAGDAFGASLVAGRFRLGCESLAVGSPGEDIAESTNAGAVDVFYSSTRSRLTGTNSRRFHQDIPGISSPTEDNDQFGAKIGIVKDGNLDDLWVASPGEAHSWCDYSAQIVYQTLQATSTGISTAGDTLYCGIFEPDTFDARGWITETQNDFGTVALYVPTGFLKQSSEATVMVHGTPGDLETGASTSNLILSRTAWLTPAENREELLVAPAFGASNFGGKAPKCWRYRTQIPCDTDGGYRGLFGKEISADAWVNLIMDDLGKVGLANSDRFKIYGHSAGAQFVSRYLYKHADRVERAIIGPAAEFIRPKELFSPGGCNRWPYNDRPGTFDQLWPGMDARVYKREDAIGDWVAYAQTSIAVVLGDKDNVGGTNPCATESGRVYEADAWVSEMNDWFKSIGQPGDIELCVVPDVGHSGFGLAMTSAQMMYQGTSATCTTTLPPRPAPGPSCQPEYGPCATAADCCSGNICAPTGVCVEFTGL